MEDIIYIILVHKNPGQLKRLIEKLDASNIHFYVHVDLKSNLSEFKAFINQSNVQFIESRVDCIWGDLSIVKATMSLVETVLENHQTGVCVLLSGQDYPIKPVDYIIRFLSTNKEKNFISMNRIEAVWSKEECVKRTEYYRFNFSSKRGDAVALKLGFKDIKTSVKSVKLLIGRKIPFSFFMKLLFKRSYNINLYGGSSWWVLNLATLKKVNRYIEENEKTLIDYFKYSFCVDEIFFHSILQLLSLEDSSIKIEDTVTYVDWERANCSLPVTFNTNDSEELLSQSPDKLFARKFDVDKDCQVLDKIDYGILSESHD